MHTTTTMHNIHTNTHLYIVICLYIVALVSLFKLVSSIFCVCPFCKSVYNGSKTPVLDLPSRCRTSICFILLSLTVILVCSVPLHTSTHLHVEACTLIGLAVAMLQTLPSCTPKLSSIILILLTIIFKFISMIIYQPSWLSHCTFTVDVVCVTKAAV